MTITCPTPTKARYATKEAADTAAARRELAIGRLINAHGTEFTRYLAEECDRLGAHLPNRCRKYLDQEEAA